MIKGGAFFRHQRLVNATNSPELTTPIRHFRASTTDEKDYTFMKGVASQVYGTCSEALKSMILTDM